MFSRRTEIRPAALCGKRHFAVGSLEQGGLRCSPAVGERRLCGRRVPIQVGKNFLDGYRVLDAGDDFDSTAALTAGFDVDVEHSLEALRPGHGRMAFGRCWSRTRRLGLAAPPSPGRRHLRTVGESSGSTHRVRQWSVGIAGGQGLQGKHLAALMWTHSDAVGDGMSVQMGHRIVIRSIPCQIAVLGIGLEQALTF